MKRDGEREMTQGDGEKEMKREKAMPENHREIQRFRSTPPPSSTLHPGRALFHPSLFFLLLLPAPSPPAQLWCEGGDGCRGLQACSPHNTLALCTHSVLCRSPSLSPWDHPLVLLNPCAPNDVTLLATGHRQPLVCVGFSSDGANLLTVDQGGNCSLWAMQECSVNQWSPRASCSLPAPTAACPDFPLAATPVTLHPLELAQ